MITIDLKDFKKFKKELFGKKARGKMNGVMRGTINDQAFTAMKWAKKLEIPRSMQVRGKFNQSLVRVTKASGRSLVAIAGAIDRKGYDGLENIELGKSEKNTMIPHIKEARGGSKKRKVSKTKRVGNPDSMKQVSRKRTLYNLSKKDYKGYFNVTNNSTKLTRGVYKFTGRKKKNIKTGFFGRSITKVRNTTNPTTTPKRHKWLLKSSKKGSSPAITQKFFNRNMDKQFIKFK